MQPLKKHVLDVIDIEGMLTLLCELVAIPSLGGEQTDENPIPIKDMRHLVNEWGVLPLSSMGRPTCDRPTIPMTMYPCQT
jgi:hypothetical protein